MSDLAPGDVITKVDGKTVELASDLQREILTKKIGQSVALDIVRQGKVLRIAVKTGEQPDKFMRASVRRPASKPPTPRSNRSAPPSTPGLTVKSATPENLASLQLQRKESGGVVITEVEPYSASAAAGLEVGDVITEAGGRPVFGPDDIEAAISLADQGHGVLLLLERRGQKTFAILKP
jgi:serine protease Do